MVLHTYIHSILFTAVPFTLIYMEECMSAVLKEAEMCNGREGEERNSARSDKE